MTTTTTTSSKLSRLWRKPAAFLAVLGAVLASVTLAAAPAMASIPDSGGTVDGPQGREAFPRQVVIVSGGMPGWEIALIAAGAAVAAAALAVLACRSWTTRRLAAARRPGAVQAQPPAVQPPASVAGGTDELGFS